MREVQSSKSNWRNQSAKIGDIHGPKKFDFKRISIILLFIWRVGDFGTKTKNNVSKKYLYAIYGFLEKSNGWRFDFRGPNYFDKGV